MNGTDAMTTKYQVCRPLTESEYRELKESIADKGILTPVEVDENGDILDGHHRVQAWQELRAAGSDLPEYPRLVRPGMSEEEKLAHAAALNSARRQMTLTERELLAERVRQLRTDGKTLQEIADTVGVSVKTVHRDLEISDLSSDDKSEITNTRGQKRPTTYAARKPQPPQQSIFVPGGAVQLDQAAASAQVREVAGFERERKRADRMAGYQEKADSPRLPDTKYRIIYADPPWKYVEMGVTVSPSYGATRWHYPSMTSDELCAMPIEGMADADSTLFLWATSPKLPDALRIIESWGFEYKTSFVWDKVKHNFGYYNSVRHEFLLVAGRGRSTPDTPTLYDSVLTIERTEHSVKPDEFRDIIDDLYPVGRRIELFARREVDGWERWGNE